MQAVSALKAIYPLRLLLQVAELAPSTFFYHQRRLTQPDPHAGLKTAIRDAFVQARGRYGHRRIHAVVRRAGWRVAKKTVLVLMRQLGLVCQVRKRRFRSYRGAVGTVAPNVLNRAFRASAPNQKWVSDVTEFRVRTEKLYLATVMDLFDRQIIGYRLGPSPTVALTHGALAQALATLEPGQSPLVHSDQGFQYQHHSWQALVTAAGAVPSMSRKGNCLDNAVMENFFGHLKAELGHQTTFTDAAALETAIHAYIAWYNTDRISLTLAGLSPVQYRAQALAA